MKLIMKGRIVGQDGRLASLKTLKTLNTELISEHLERIATIMLLCAMLKNNAMERKIKNSTSIQNIYLTKNPGSNNKFTFLRSVCIHNE